MYSWCVPRMWNILFFRGLFENRYESHLYRHSARWIRDSSTRLPKRGKNLAMLRGSLLKTVSTSWSSWRRNCATELTRVSLSSTRRELILCLWICWPKRESWPCVVLRGVTGAALSASYELHNILHARLMDVIDHLLPPVESPNPSPPHRNQMLYFPEREISVERDRPLEQLGLSHWVYR